MKSPEDVRKALRRHWENKRSLWLAGDGQWSLVFTLGSPAQSAVQLQMESVRNWVRAWQETNIAGQVEWRERQWQDLGRQHLPSRLILKSPEEVAAWVGEDRRWRLAQTRYNGIIERWPRLSTCLRTHFDVLADYSEQDLQRLKNMLAWFDKHPQSGLFPRQLPIVGLDSKWLESRKGLIGELVGALREVDTSALDIFRICGIRPPPSLMRIAILDPALRACIGGLRDVTSPVEELARLNLSPKCTFIVENI